MLFWISQRKRFSRMRRVLSLRTFERRCALCCASLTFEWRRTTFLALKRIFWLTFMSILIVFATFNRASWMSSELRLAWSLWFSQRTTTRNRNRIQRRRSLRDQILRDRALRDLFDHSSSRWCAKELVENDIIAASRNVFEENKKSQWDCWNSEVNRSFFESKSAMCCLNVIFLVIYSLFSSSLFSITFLNLCSIAKKLIQINNFHEDRLRWHR